MRTTLKIVLPLIVSVAAVSLLFAAYQVRREKRILRNDLSRRAEILARNLQESVEPLLEHAQERNLQRLGDRIGPPGHFKSVAIFNPPRISVPIYSPAVPLFTFPSAAAP